MPQGSDKPDHPRILIVDDDPGTATMVRAWFQGKAFKIETASNGERGLAAAFRETPDLILLDLKMPGLDGISVARRLKNDARTMAVPLILLTACRDVESKVESFSAGADDYVTKPFAVEEVAARIEGMLRKRQMMAVLQTQLAQAQQENQELEQAAMVDEKTGLFNFREFQRRLRGEWERAERYSVPLALVFFDLDFFKQINDTLGHPAGDRVLQEFATLVAGGARANDTAARYGGEEFAVVLPHTLEDMAVRVAERIRVAVEQFIFLADETPTHVTVSAGVATVPSSVEMKSVDDLIRAADRALYHAKENGRNCVIRAVDVPRVAG